MPGILYGSVGHAGCCHCHLATAILPPVVQPARQPPPSLSLGSLIRRHPAQHSVLELQHRSPTHGGPTARREDSPGRCELPASEPWVVWQNHSARTHDEARSMVSQRRSPEASLAGEAERTALFKCHRPASRWVRAEFACGADPGLARSGSQRPGLSSGRTVGAHESSGSVRGE